MKFCCHGVRGSCPVTLSPSEIAFLMSRLVSSIGKKLGAEAFFRCASTPASLLQTIRSEIKKENLHTFFGIGGNTPSIELFPESHSQSKRVIFDLGSGICKLDQCDDVEEVHIFLTHFHFDHLQGLPFCETLTKENVAIHLYSPVKRFESILDGFIRPPYFPLKFRDLVSPQLHFHDLSSKESYTLDSLRFTWMPIPHPGGSHAYKVSNGSRSFCYFSDVSLVDNLYAETPENISFLKNIDTMILDASVGFMDSIEKKHWGHTNLFDGLDFCKHWGVKSMYMFHSYPTVTVSNADLNYQTALWYNAAIQSPVKVFLAQEDIEFVV